MSSRIRKCTFFILAVALFGCGGSDNPAEPGASGSENPLPPTQGRGFGVSGLLFENNLIMWFRDNDGRRSELFPQMYFTRMDAENYPVWGKFPEQYVVSGGVPRDGIPALVNPKFVQPNSPEVDYLQETDLVLGAVVNGEARAYPENILWWHEIANDVIAGQGVIMTLCPLTGTGLFFRAPVDGNTVERLELLPVIETTWAKWKELYPNTLVISRETGFDRNYRIYPYSSYRQEDTSPLFPLRTAPIDRRFPPKHTVLGLIEGEVQKAYPFRRLEGQPVINDMVNGRPVLIVSELENRLAIPYDRRVDGQTLTFSLVSAQPFEMRDDQTGSTWNIKGEATAGSLQGMQLTQIPAYNAFWFAWEIFWPQTEVFEGGS